MCRKIAFPAVKGFKDDVKIANWLCGLICLDDYEEFISISDRKLLRDTH